MTVETIKFSQFASGGAITPTDNPVGLRAGVNTEFTQDSVPGEGTVTSITAGTGLTGGTITTSGTIALNPNYEALINVKQYGATGNGTTDDTGAIQAAITAVEAIAGGLYFPFGKYNISSSLIITRNIYIQGCGWILDSVNTTSGSLLVQSTAGQATFSIQTPDQVILKNLGFYTADYTDAGSECIQVNGSSNFSSPTANNNYSIFDGLMIHAGYTGIRLYASQGLVIKNCNIEQGQNSDYQSCIQIDNLFANNNGDTLIEGCYLASTKYVINHTSGSGIRIANNKMFALQAASVSFNCTATNTSDIYINDNSIEGSSINHILMNCTNHYNFQLLDNEFEIAGSGASNVVQVGNPSFTGITNAIVSGNVFYARGTYSGGSGVAVYQSTDFIISNNVFGGNGTGVPAIYIDSSAQDGQVYGNQISSTYSNSYNLSTTVSFESKGTATMSGGTATISNTLVNSGSLIIPASQSTGVTGALSAHTIVANTSFIVTSSNAGDAGIIGYTIQ
jgi:hypothetical protein